jgi:hypothetical protein
MFLSLPVPFFNLQNWSGNVSVYHRNESIIDESGHPPKMSKIKNVADVMRNAICEIIDFRWIFKALGDILIIMAR